MWFGFFFVVSLALEENLNKEIVVVPFVSKLGDLNKTTYVGTKHSLWLVVEHSSKPGAQAKVS